MKINNVAWDRLWYVVEYQTVADGYWHSCCNATFGTIEAAERHMDHNRQNLARRHCYRIMAHASGLPK